MGLVHYYGHMHNSATEIISVHFSTLTLTLFSVKLLLGTYCRREEPIYHSLPYTGDVTKACFSA